MRWFAAAAAFALTGALALPAMARESYVIDNAHLLSSSTIAQVNAKVGDFAAQTHKEVVVDTEPTVAGDSANAAAERIFAQQQVNGVLIYVAKQPKTIGVYVDRASARFFPAGSTDAIRNAIRSAFNQGDFDGGITNGVDLTLSQFRSHLNSLPRGTTFAPAPVAGAPYRATGGFSMSWIWWLIVLAVIFFIVRGVFRAIAGPRVYPPGYGGPGYGGPGYGGPGYGPGYGGGWGGGGGGFWSGLLGGLGGAWLGNELFGRGGWGGGTYAGVEPGTMVDPSVQQDAGGWQNDAGQIDMGDSSSGSWGDSGGGWGGGGDSGGGWGDAGGGGDSGGGW